MCDGPLALTTLNPFNGLKTVFVRTSEPPSHIAKDTGTMMMNYEANLPESTLRRLFEED